MPELCVTHYFMPAYFATYQLFLLQRPRPPLLAAVKEGLDFNTLNPHNFSCY